MILLVTGMSSGSSWVNSQMYKCDISQKTPFGNLDICTVHECTEGVV